MNLLCSKDTFEPHLHIIPPYFATENFQFQQFVTAFLPRKEEGVRAPHEFKVPSVNLL